MGSGSFSRAVAVFSIFVSGLAQAQEEDCLGDFMRRLSESAARSEAGDGTLGKSPPITASQSKDLEALAVFSPVFEEKNLKRYFKTVLGYEGIKKADFDFFLRSLEVLPEDELGALVRRVVDEMSREITERYMIPGIDPTVFARKDLGLDEVEFWRLRKAWEESGRLRVEDARMERLVRGRLLEIADDHHPEDKFFKGAMRKSAALGGKVYSVLGSGIFEKLLAAELKYRRQKARDFFPTFRNFEIPLQEEFVEGLMSALDGAFSGKTGRVELAAIESRSRLYGMDRLGFVDLIANWRSLSDTERLQLKHDLLRTLRQKSPGFESKVAMNQRTFPGRPGPSLSFSHRLLDQARDRAHFAGIEKLEERWPEMKSGEKLDLTAKHLREFSQSELQWLRERGLAEGWLDPESELASKLRTRLGNLARYYAVQRKIAALNGTEVALGLQALPGSNYELHRIFDPTPHDAVRALSRYGRQIEGNELVELTSKLFGQNRGLTIVDGTPWDQYQATVAFELLRYLELFRMKATHVYLNEKQIRRLSTLLADFSKEGVPEEFAGPVRRFEHDLKNHGITLSTPLAEGVPALDAEGRRVLRELSQ